MPSVTDLEYYIFFCFLSLFSLILYTEKIQTNFYIILYNQPSYIGRHVWKQTCTQFSFPKLLSYETGEIKRCVLDGAGADGSNLSLFPPVSPILCLSLSLSLGPLEQQQKMLEKSNFSNILPKHFFLFI